MGFSPYGSSLDRCLDIKLGPKDINVQGNVGLIRLLWKLFASDIFSDIGFHKGVHDMFVYSIMSGQVELKSVLGIPNLNWSTGQVGKQVYLEPHFVEIKIIFPTII